MTTTANPNGVASARQQLVEVTGWPGYFANFTGGEIAGEVEKTYDGGSLKPENHGGPPETSNVVVGRPYRPGPHGPIRKEWARQVMRLRTTVKVWDTDPDLGPIGQPRIYANALLVRLTAPEHDAASSTASTIEMEFAVEEEA